jgi:hypothetical protein
MISKAPKLLQILVGLALFMCLLAPFVELAAHSDGSIFVDGHDTESTIAILLVVLELVIALARLFVLPFARVIQKLNVIYFHHLSRLAMQLVVPEVASPVPLRV